MDIRRERQGTGKSYCGSGVHKEGSQRRRAGEGARACGIVMGLLTASWADFQ
jgi:hypothetical protein